MMKMAMMKMAMTTTSALITKTMKTATFNLDDQSDLGQDNEDIEHVDKKSNKVEERLDIEVSRALRDIISVLRIATIHYHHHGLHQGS